ncbi:hypothetical protein V3W47_16470, partial [Deinococcus sp. YIM 134068]|uniref:hypothetical protein n=1 Tax=Deinococcus lichenicola TaxID=3118910 RepID=UPI002F960358
AADAANGEDTPTVTDEDLRSLGILDDQATSVQKVPGGGAAGPAPEAPCSPSLDDLKAVDRAELLKRPVAAPDGPQWKRVRELLGKDLFVDVLKQPTLSGGLNREDWFRLSLAEIEQVARAAQVDAQAGRKKMGTGVIWGLDRLIGGASAAPKPVKAGERLRSPIHDVKNVGVKVAVFHTPQEGEPPKLGDSIEVGSRWEHKRQEDRIVTVVAYDGPSVDLHTGEKLSSFLLSKDYRRVH